MGRRCRKAEPFCSWRPPGGGGGGGATRCGSACVGDGSCGSLGWGGRGGGSISVVEQRPASGKVPVMASKCSLM